MSASPWLTDPALTDRFHPESPNDLQVLIHDGEPRRTKLAFEAAWVTVTGVHGTLRMPLATDAAEIPLDVSGVSWSERPVYEGVLLNDPAQLASVQAGDTLLFVHCPGVPHPVQVTKEYLAERSLWAVTPCQACGADQAFDPPSVMAQTRFPGAPAGSTPISFTARCPCGGAMVLSRVNGVAAEAAAGTGSAAGAEGVGRKPWWKRW